MLNSPLAAATRARVYHLRTRPRPRELGLRLFGIFGALLVHLLFLFGFVLGPAFQVVPPPASKQQFMQVRLVESPEPPPPPPVRGTPPKERGPRHQGHASRPRSREPSRQHAGRGRRAAGLGGPAGDRRRGEGEGTGTKAGGRPSSPVSLPQPAPTPELQPVPLAGEPPAATLPTPVLQPPVPPKYRPSRCAGRNWKATAQCRHRRAGVAGAAAAGIPPIAVSGIALDTEVPDPPRPPA
ncbi:hypothetical protein [Rhodanobacter sp. FW106-PBR-LB-2-11]|uniref:hypothetical protein n=1 Tax=Rhodanobacter sp. FW106-PBR-LB-2-11 TaxID=1524463 RepID=UPI0034E52164